MSVLLAIRNESIHKRLYRGDALRRLADRICGGEGVEEDVELSVLLCDDPRIRALNGEYRGQDTATDVLSFSQGPPGPARQPRTLGDIVISLETVAARCTCGPGTSPTAEETRAMRDDVRLLFCHGLLHLLEYHHATERDRERMAAKQAEYLGVAIEAAWGAPRTTRSRSPETAPQGGTAPLGR